MYSSIRFRFRAALLTLALTPAAALIAQYGGPVRTWWNAGTGELLSWDEDYADPTGQTGIRNTVGAVHTEGHPFFEALGENGRACITCHQPANAMSLSAATVRTRWIETGGRDPLFAAVDGSNCPSLPQKATGSHSLLLDRGLFRIALPWPPKAADGTAVTPEFQIEVVRDPTGCNTSREYGLTGAHPFVSVYRRPRIAANFNYVAAPGRPFAFMADGRESNLRSQAISAALTHEQARAAPSEEELQRIIEFESQIYAAQSSDARGGLMYEANGPLPLGPDSMARGRAGIFDADGPQSRAIWQSFDTWKNSAATLGPGVQSEFRASVARGAAVFSSRRFIVGEIASLGRDATCASCHSAGVARWMDIGTTNHQLAEASPDLPLFKITCTMGTDQGSVVYTQDPGRALITGKCADVGAIVMQQLRGLSARAPYFTDGSAQTLRAVVEFYDRRFRIGLTENEKHDLIDFLSVL